MTDQHSEHEQHEHQQGTLLWLFIGAIFVIYGIIIFITGLVHYIRHSLYSTALANLHPDMVWGTVLFIVGVLFVIFNWHHLKKNKALEHKSL